MTKWPCFISIIGGLGKFPFFGLEKPKQYMLYYFVRAGSLKRYEGFIDWGRMWWITQAIRPWWFWGVGEAPEGLEIVRKSCILYTDYCYYSLRQMPPRGILQLFNHQLMDTNSLALILLLWWFMTIPSKSPWEDRTACCLLCKLQLKWLESFAGKNSLLLPTFLHWI